MRPPWNLLLVAGVLVAGCEAEPPARPAWDQDVLPLLQGRCNHCHGETVGQTIDPETGMPAAWMPKTRLDFCNAQAMPVQDLGITFLGGAALFIPGQFDMYLEPEKGTGRAKMPPPPAEPLSAYEYQVLKRWAKIAGFEAAAGCLKAVRNRAPQVKLVNAPREAGDVVEAVIEITDVDNDGILGKATLGSATFDILGGGRRILKFPKGTPVGATLGVTVTDGYDTTRL
jgi:hypothetical protein